MSNKKIHQEIQKDFTEVLKNEVKYCMDLLQEWNRLSKYFTLCSNIEDTIKFSELLKKTRDKIGIKAIDNNTGERKEGRKN